jgi:type II secretory pathway component PulK
MSGRRSQSRRQRRRGFALIAAVLLLGLVVVAVTLLTSAAAADGQRTLERHQRAQLDQMLLAATADARAHLKSSNLKSNDSWKLDLPAALSEQSAAVETTVTAIEPDHIDLYIRARLANRSAEQMLRFARANDGWRLSTAQIPID